MDCLQPQMQREVAILEDGANPNGEWLTAAVAFVEAGTSGFAAQATNLGWLLPRLAMRAYRTVGPKLGLNIFKGFRLIVKSVVEKCGLGHNLPRFVEAIYIMGLGMSSETSPINIP